MRITSFNQAMLAVTAGAKMRRKNWAEGTFIFLGLDQNVKCYRVQDTGLSAPHNYTIHETDVQAKDWSEFPTVAP